MVKYYINCTYCGQKIYLGFKKLYKDREDIRREFENVSVIIECGACGKNNLLGEVFVETCASSELCSFSRTFFIMFFVWFFGCLIVNNFLREHKYLALIFFLMSITISFIISIRLDKREEEYERKFNSSS